MHAPCLPVNVAPARYHTNHPETMKGILFSTGVVLLLVVSACGTSDKQTEALEAPSSAAFYAAQSVLLAKLPDGVRVRIAHEDIPGLMKGMTMSFAVADTSLISTVQVQDSIRFTLKSDEGERFITDMSSN